MFCTDNVVADVADYDRNVGGEVTDYADTVVGNPAHSKGAVREETDTRFLRFGIGT